MQRLSPHGLHWPTVDEGLDTAALTSVSLMLDKVIESGFSKASEINRNDLLEYKEKKINKRVPLVLTYHPSLEKIAGIVRHHPNGLAEWDTLKTVLRMATTG
jgi:hypothetical protein